MDLRDLEILTESSAAAIHVRGVKYDSPLNQLPYFHIMEIFVKDIMHKVLEGVGPYVSSLILSSLIQFGLITIDEINNDVQIYFP